MSSRRELTGGTGDVNPQYLTMYAAQTSTNGTAINNTPIPINRFAQRRGKGMVMEILKIHWQVNLALTLNSTGSQNVFWQAQLSTKSLSAYNPLDGTVIDQITDQMVYWQPATATALISRPATMPIIHDMTDNAGHGIIVATDQLYLFFDTVGFSNAETVFCKIYYRFKEVSLEEYIGIVQSQQS